MFLEFLTERGYTVSAIDDYSLLYKIERGSFSRFVSDIDFNSAAAAKLLKDKLLTYLVLQDLEICVPTGTYFLLGNHQYSDSPEQIMGFLKTAQYPLILKPNDSSLGKGLTVFRNYNQQRAERAIAKVKQYSEILIIQEYISGQEYRVVAVEGEIIFALKKYKRPQPPKETSWLDRQFFRDIVQKSMKHTGSTVCGFDFIVDRYSTKVLEVNSNPFMFRIVEYLSETTVNRYFLKLEQLLRMNYG